MIEDLPSLKAASIGRCVSRAREVYARDPNTFTADLPTEAATIFNSLRGCQATLGRDQHLIDGELRRAPQNTDEHAHAWACIPAISAPGPEASKARAPSLERRSHQTVYADYSTCIDGQRYRLSKNRSHATTERTMDSRATP